MITLPPDLKFLEKPLGYLSWRVTSLSALRVIGWSCLFLALFHFLMPGIKPKLPYSKDMSAQSLTPVATAPNDLRWSRLDYKQLPDNSVMWISGSSHAIYNTQDKEFDFLPAYAKKYLPEEFSHFVNLKMATRALDNYTAVRDAIARQPAALVVTLNPFWILNEQALFLKPI